MRLGMPRALRRFTTMTAPLPQASVPVQAGRPIPRYLQKVYWWAYVHPRAVRVFERGWLVNAILLGNYRRLCEVALSRLGEPVRGATLQLACVYGDLTARLLGRMLPDASLDVVDVLPIQLDNLARKLPSDPRVTLYQGDASALPISSESYDQALLFFLLHEQPEAVRRATLAEAMRIVKPGGKIVVVDYHRPVKWHPLRPVLRLVFRLLEPYAIDLWKNDIESFLPPQPGPVRLTETFFFGELYQCVVITR